MSRTSSKRVLAIALVLSTSSGITIAGATDAPRYAISASPVQPAPMRATADGRYLLEARLKPADDTRQHGSGIELQATVTSAPATACSVAGDLIFANGFQ
jgi:hypothetical protein